jgi:hypothetical protein
MKIEGGEKAQTSDQTHDILIQTERTIKMVFPFLMKVVRVLLREEREVEGRQV